MTSHISQVHALQVIASLTRVLSSPRFWVHYMVLEVDWNSLDPQTLYPIEGNLAENWRSMVEAAF